MTIELIWLVFFLFTQLTCGDWFTKAWSGKTFPTKDFFPEKELLDAKGKPSVAIAFSGGGVNAYANTIGILAALTKLDLIKYVRYIGGVSGSAWASTGYTYDQTNGVNDTIRLGRIIPPEDFTDEILNELHPNCLLTRLSTNFEDYGLNLVFMHGATAREGTTFINYFSY